MRDLFISLPTGVRPRLALEQELRSAIRSGRLATGSVLPSTRALAADLGIARSTVVAAYEQLIVEGYILGEQGRATRVAEISVPQVLAADVNPMGVQPAHDFRPGEPAAGSFPRREWQRSMRHVLMGAPDEVFGYGDPRGRRELRESLARYLARARGVHVDAAAVRVYAGFAPSLGFLGEMLKRRGITRIAVEQPMLGFHRQILHLVGVQTAPIEVDENGLRVEDLQAANAQAVLVTPGNQQPLGVTMSAARRNGLISWAAAVDGWIIEDDYDGEFRYDRRPIAALQGLDPDRVIYAGTASKSLGPGLHLSWLVVPRELRSDLGAVTQMRAGVSTINQLGLADFVDRGAYDRHVRRQRRVYQQRRQRVLDRLTTVGWLEVAPSQGGLHLVARIIDDRINEADLLRAAAASSVGLMGLQTHFEHGESGVLINVSRPADHQYVAATEALFTVLALV